MESERACSMEPECPFFSRGKDPASVVGAAITVVVLKEVAAVGIGASIKQDIGSSRVSCPQLFCG